MTSRLFLFMLTGSLLTSGCSWPVRERINAVVCDMSSRPYDQAPQSTTQPPRPNTLPPSAPTRDGASLSPQSVGQDPGQPNGLVPGPTAGAQTPRAEAAGPGGHDLTVVGVATDTKTAAWLQGPATPAAAEITPFSDASGVQQAAWIQRQAPPQRKVDLNIPPEIPGSEAPRVELPKDNTRIAQEISRIYPELPPLPVQPVPQMAANGRPYTLADLQQMAAASSPTLRQAIADVETTRGLLVQARTYQNPNLSYMFDPSNNNSVGGVQGFAAEQVISMGGKMKMQVASAQKSFENAELALRRARSDLSTAVRNAYFTFLVDKETLVITRALGQFTDEIYRVQTGLLRGAVAAPYEPASLRAQAFAMRLAYKQAIESYIYDWKQLVATIGMPQMPLSDVAGQVDRLIPYYDYDRVLAYALQNHTDVLTARNLIPQAKYNLKLAQVTPLVPDIDLRGAVERDTSLFPFGTYHTFSVTLPVSMWDQNRGNIMAAQASLARAVEESHRVEVTLTDNLAAAYANYQNNLYALEYYRRFILPDLVRYYRGIYARRQVDPSSPFGDLVNAQQMLSANATAYIGVLGNLWTSVVDVANFLQTDDLFQMAEARELPEVPDLQQLWQLPCGHGQLAEACLSRVGGGAQGAMPPIEHLPVPSTLPAQPALQSAQPGVQSPTTQPAAGPGQLSIPVPQAPALFPPSPLPASPARTDGATWGGSRGAGRAWPRRANRLRAPARHLDTRALS